MTLQEIYKKCKCWMYEKTSSTIYDSYIGEIANKVLAEIFEENNMCRMFKGKVPLLSIPQVDPSQTGYMDTEFGEGGLGMMDEYMLDVIPKGIDASFLMDDDMSKMSILQTEYNNARVAHQCAVSKEVIDRLTKEAQDAS